MLWLSLVLCALAPAVQGATEDFDWCYHEASCGPSSWPVQVPEFCNGSRQSPIDIVTQDVAVDSKLTDFTFTKFDDKTMLSKIENTGQTVKVSFEVGVEVSGGNLPEKYDSLQFHLHWGNGADVPGSEHTVDGKRYPMELHIVNLKSSHNGNTTAAVADGTGAAALGFFIESVTNTTGEPQAWKTLASYLSSITEKGQNATMAPGISLDDLLPGVNRSRYYRYLGSLTTPLCYEAVVWTVFKEPVKVSKDLIDMFSNTVRIGNGTSAFMREVYRGLQKAQPVTHNSSSKMNFSYGLFILMFALWMR